MLRFFSGSITAKRTTPPRRFAAVCLVWSVLSPAIAGGQKSDTTVVTVKAPADLRARLLEGTPLRGRDGADPEWNNVLLFPAANGGLFVVDLTDPARTGAYRSTLTQFDSSGRFVRTIGAVGQGPGEFQGWIGGVAQLKDGRILVTDSRGVLVFTEKGVSITRWNATGNTLASGGAIFADPSGLVYVASRRGLGYGTPSSLEPILFRFRADGSLIDTVGPPQASFDRRPDPYKLERTRVPFGPQYLSAWSPAGHFVTAYSATYAIELPSPPQAAANGARPAAPWRENANVVSLRRAVPAVPIGAAEREDWKLSVTTYSRSPTPGRWENWQWHGADIPKNKAPITLLGVDADARIWVRLAQPSVLHPDVILPTLPASPRQGYEILAKKRWVEPAVFDVMAPEGRLLGQIELPPRTGHPDLRAVHTEASFSAAGNTLWAVVYDEDDVPVVRRYRIAWPDKP